MNLKVAICDDEREWIDIIRKRLETYTIETDITFDISDFNDPDNLMNSYKEPGAFNILFLDMEVPIAGIMKKGIDVARQIRSLPDDDLKIIFFSNYPEYMNLGYDVRASHYLEKNVPTKKFFCVLTDVITDMTRDKSMIRVKTNRDSWQLIKISDIRYIIKPYSIRDKIIYHTMNEQIEEHKSINSAEEDLKSYGFAPASKYYLVNFRHIRKFTSNKIIMDDGEEIELSRRYRQDFHKLFSHNILTIQ